MIRAILIIKCWDGNEIREDLGTYEDRAALHRGVTTRYYALRHEEDKALHCGRAPPWAWWRIDPEQVEGRGR